MKTTFDRPSTLHFRRVLLAVLAAGLFVCAPAAHAGLGLGTPEPFDPEIVLPANHQDDVHAAGPDSVALFVWVDQRTGEPESRIYGARVRADGTVIDQGSIEISSAGHQTLPAVAWDGTQWLVIWTEVVGGFADGIYGVRVGVDGKLLDPAPIEIANDPVKREAFPEVAWNGTRFIVVFTEFSGNNTIVAGLTVDSDGLATGPATPISPFADAIEPAIAALGSTVLVAWEHADSILASRVGLSGGPNPIAVLDATPLVISASGMSREHRAAVAASTANNEWLVGFTGLETQAPDQGVYARRVAANGTLPGPARIDIDTGSGEDVSVALTAHDSAWLAVYGDLGNGTLLRSVPANGSPAGAPLTVSTEASFHPCFGGDPEAPIVGWSQQTNSGPLDIYGRVVSDAPGPGLELGDTFLLGGQTPNQTEPALAFSGARWMVAWVDDRFGPTLGQIRVAFTDSAKLAPPNVLPIDFAALRPEVGQYEPTATYDGTNFNLIWSEERGGYRRIVAARFTAGGAFIDTFEVSPGGNFNQTEPTSAASINLPGEVVVAWTDDRAGYNDRDIWQATLKNGAVLAAEGRVSGAVGQHDERPSLAPADDFRNTFLVYQREIDSNQSEIRATYLETTPAFSSGFLLMGDAGHRYEDPKIAYNGEDWMITFQEIVDNDGPLLHIPMVQYYSATYGSFNPQLIAPGSYAPARPVVGSAGYAFVSIYGDLAGGQIDVDARSLFPGQFPPDAGPLPVTDDAPADIPGAAEHGLLDRVGLLFMRAQSDAEWNGTRLFSLEAQDTLAGKVVINEFLANPPSLVPEFYELFNVSGRTFRLNGWKLVVNGQPETVIQCFTDRPLPPGGNETNGSLCGDFPDQTFFSDDQFDEIPPGPQGFLPNRSARLQLFSPQGVLVDQVAYGDSGAAPVSGAIPDSIAPRRPVDVLDRVAARGPIEGPTTLAPGDSIPVSTSRIPNGTDTDNDGTDFNLTTNTTPGDPNVGTAAAPGTKIFFTRVYAKGPPGVDAVEFFNPSSSQTFDFTNWYLSDGEALERIGVPNTAFGRMEPGQKTILRQGERGSFTFGLDYDDVLYLYDDQLSRVEQIAWWRDDLAFPDACQTRVPETGGLHTGFSWITSGGLQNLNAGEIRYTACAINAPAVDVPAPGSFTLSFAGALPNPARSTQNPVLAFTVPGVPGPESARPVRIRLFDVAGRLVATPLDAFREAGEHRVPLAGAIRAAGVYYAELDVNGRREMKSVVILP